MAIGHLFSQRFGYAVHALAYMASKPSGELTTLPELAKWMRTLWPNASETYLSQVMQHLAKGQLLRSHRGIAGGYSLARPATKITVRDVAELIDGAHVDECTLSFAGECPREPACGIRLCLSKPAVAFLKSLERVSMADLSEDVETPQPKTKRKRPK